MKPITAAQLKFDLSRDIKYEFNISRLPGTSAWNLLMCLNSDFEKDVFVLVGAQDRAMRNFKTLDAVISTLQACGVSVNTLNCVPSVLI
jgi:hypothetical protein